MSAQFAAYLRLPKFSRHRSIRHVAEPLKNGIRIGIAGWSLPPALRGAQVGHRSLLEHYATLFNAVEINSSFHRPHRLATYQRWRLSVPESFRFAVKVPKLITHERRLVKCQDEITSFLTGVLGLGDRLGTLLVQLPPSSLFDPSIAQDFFRAMRTQTSVPIGCEARHASWFGNSAAAVFDEYRVTPVLADPARAGCEFSGRENEHRYFSYRRLHGSPRMYYSAYGAQYLQEIASAVRASAPAQPGAEHWYTFDNTAAGAAWSDAQMLQRLVGDAGGAPPGQKKIDNLIG